MMNHLKGFTEYENYSINQKIEFKKECDFFYINQPRKGFLKEAENRFFHRENMNSLVKKYSRKKHKKIPQILISKIC